MNNHCDGLSRQMHADSEAVPSLTRISPEFQPIVTSIENLFFTCIAGDHHSSSMVVNTAIARVVITVPETWHLATSY